MRFIPRLISHVENISSNLMDQFSLVVDGWTANSTHYLSVYTSLAADNKEGYSTRLLVLYSSDDETRLCAEEHVKFLSYVLEVFNGPFENVVCVIEDSLNTEKNIEDTVSLLLIGYGSHRFSLAMRDFYVSMKIIFRKLIL